MGTIYEKIKKSSVLKANAALISGAADAAPTYQDLSTNGGKNLLSQNLLQLMKRKKN